MDLNERFLLWYFDVQFRSIPDWTWTKECLCGCAHAEWKNNNFFLLPGLLGSKYEERYNTPMRKKKKTT
jgi:hypothetical protein